MTTKQRPDVAQRIKDRQEIDETVVKCSLKKILYNNSNLKISEAIQNRVDSYSRRIVRASIAVNLLIRQIIDASDDLQTTEFPTFWDLTFVRQLMLGTDSAHYPEPTIEELYVNFPFLLSTSERYPEDRNIYTYGAKKFATNIKNHLRMNLENMIKKYLYDVSGLTKVQASDAVCFLFKWKKKDLDEPIVVEQISLLQRLLGSEQVNKQYLRSENKLPNILKLFVFVNRALEQNGQKMYNLLPICTTRHHFITIDTSVLKGILKDAKCIKEDSKDTLDMELWESFFKISSVQGKDKVFTRTIDTDGCAINLHFHRPKKQKEENPEINLEGKRVLGCDDGRTNLLMIVEEEAPEVYKKYRLTRRQYYNESGINSANECSKRWNKGLKDSLLILSNHSPKSPSLDRFMEYIDAYLSVEDSLWKEYTKRRWAEQRLRLYGGKKRVFANFFNRLGDPSNTVIAYGNSKFAPGGHNEVSVPVCRAFKEASYRFVIKLVDEFRSTIVNYKTHQVLEKVMKRQKDGKLVSVRGLLWCDSTVDSEGKFVDRDMNAAINIRNLALGPRPRIFDRRYAKKKLERCIGRILTC